MISEKEFYEMPHDNFCRDQDGNYWGSLEWALGMDIIGHSDEITIMINQRLPDVMHPYSEGDVSSILGSIQKYVENPLSGQFITKGAIQRSFMKGMISAAVDMVADDLLSFLLHMRHRLNFMRLVVPDKEAKVFISSDQPSYINNIDAMLRGIVSSVILTSYFPSSVIGNTLIYSSEDVNIGIRIMEKETAMSRPVMKSKTNSKDGLVKVYPFGYELVGETTFSRIMVPYLEGVCMRVNMFMAFALRKGISNVSDITGFQLLYNEQVADLGKQMMTDPRYRVTLLQNHEREMSSFSGRTAKMAKKSVDNFVSKYNLPVQISPDIRLSKVNNIPTPATFNPSTCLDL